ncbi:DUF3000 domain-containing protein [Nesterenkonia halobia]
MTILGPAGSGTGAGAGHPARPSPPGLDELPEPFRTALGELRRARTRREALVEEIPAPSRLAPYAVALRAEVPDPATMPDHPSPNHPAHAARASRSPHAGGSGPVPDDAELLAAGRFVLLHEPAGHETWDGTFRVVIYIRAELDAEMGDDPLLASVAWTWLRDALGQYGVEHHHAGGTATRILSESFGSLEDRGPSNTVELRASWTPTGRRFDAHLEAWADMVCSFAGLPALPDGVVAMPHLRRN